jgi:hypothetical protein
VRAFSIKTSGILPAAIRNIPLKLVKRVLAGYQRKAHVYTPDLMRKAFGDLDIQVMDETETELSEGDSHSGLSAVIGLVPWSVVFEIRDGGQ